MEISKENLYFYHTHILFSATHLKTQLEKNNMRQSFWSREKNIVHTSRLVFEV